MQKLYQPPLFSAAKDCRTCGLAKAKDGFHKGTAPDGLQYDCKACRSEASREARPKPEAVRHLAERGAKLCSVCRSEKPASAFNKRRASRDGLSAKCRECDNAAARRWKTANAERHRETSRRWYEDNIERGRLTRREYYENNRDFVLDLAKRWREGNPEKRRDSEHRRRQAKGTTSADCSDSIALVRKDPCSYCNGPGGSVDHIVALFNGGAHEPGNLAGACRSCNASKGTKDLLTFMLGRRLAS